MRHVQLLGNENIRFKDLHTDGYLGFKILVNIGVYTPLKNNYYYMIKSQRIFKCLISFKNGPKHLFKLFIYYSHMLF